MHILLVFQQRAVQWRDQFAIVCLADRFWIDIFVQQKFNPVEQFRGRGFLFQPRLIANLEAKGFASNSPELQQANLLFSRARNATWLPSGLQV